MRALPVSTSPFLKWAGGKRRLLPVIRAHFPGDYGAFIEPFVGGGAAFFDVAPSYPLIADANARLIRTYRAVRDCVESVIDHLSALRNDPETYSAIRSSGDLDSKDDAIASATFIFLNKTCFNGLYRVNSKNAFNVPYGRNARALVCDAEALRACSAALAEASIEHASFEDTMAKAEPGDFCYCDPPYVPASANDFVDYTAGGFSSGQHEVLRDLALSSKRRGVRVLISNSDTPRVRHLYRGAEFKIFSVTAPRSIAANVERRRAAPELLIANY